MNFHRKYSYYKILVLFFFLFNSCKENAQTISEHDHTNDLIHETSPYLLQHAHNPVNWRAWSPEVLKEAEKANKLVLLSIGYSSCHWCHVMEEETFEDEEVAKLMNADFVSIKVDREERPDVDQVYQTAIQLLGRNGGWPLNAIILPNGKPLYLGTYLPKKQWIETLSKISKMYTEDPKEANAYADRLSQGIQETNILEPSSEFEKLTQDAVNTAVGNWSENWDPQFGGNKGRQKFMMPSTLGFLLDYAVLTKDERTLGHVKNTLDQMAKGGIYDHVGGGFFRYSTDPQWKVPHFEKMLYDNAQLISLYSKAYKVFKDPNYKAIVYGTITFLNREMKNPAGGYFAALDADSEGEEGKFYVWSMLELQSVLGDDMAIFSTYFNITKENVWENDTYILYKKGNEKDFLKEKGVSPSDFEILKTKWVGELLKVKEERVRPTIDDKIITSWNALLIKGLVDAHSAFGENGFLEDAVSILEFLTSKSYSNGTLLHSYKEGSKRSEGFLEDYTFLADAALHLYGATLDTAYLALSEKLTETVLNEFDDAATGMFRYTQKQELISKIIKTDDGVIPSPNAVMAHNLMKLGHIQYDLKYIERSKTMTTTVLPQLTEHAYSYAHWGNLLLNFSHPYYEIAVVGSNAEKLVAQLRNNHLPNTLVVGSAAASDLPLFKGRYVEGGTYIYVCQNSSCKLPVKTVEEALAQLKGF